MIIAAWIALGAALGLMAHRIAFVHTEGGALGAGLLGLTGSAIGMLLLLVFSPNSATGFTLSLASASIGAIGLLAAAKIFNVERQGGRSAHT